MMIVGLAFVCPLWGCFYRLGVLFLGEPQYLESILGTPDLGNSHVQVGTKWTTKAFSLVGSYSKDS